MIIRKKRPREKFLRRIPRYWLGLREYRRRVATRRRGNSQTQHVEIDMARTFTFSEAETLLPVLESLLRSAMQAKAFIEEVDAEFESLRSRDLRQWRHPG